MLKEIHTYLILAAIATLLVLSILFWSAHVGMFRDPADDDLVELRRVFARYESIGPEFMYDQNKSYSPATQKEAPKKNETRHKRRTEASH
ncbi:MAG: hypothetical protein HGJ94_18430 [Desulfosarcina sp.]|nr:hypothetical protein [Desulfosarcina sp.]